MMEDDDISIINDFLAENVEPNEPEEPEESEGYELYAMMDHRRAGTRYEYLVLWDNEEEIWEPASSFTSEGGRSALQSYRMNARNARQRAYRDARRARCLNTY